jgi:hypothetical protein
MRQANRRISEKRGKKLYLKNPSEEEVFVDDE